MDLTTMRAQIKSELRMDSRYVDGAIADAIEFCRKEPLKFNGGSYNFTLEADRNAYPLPKDYLALRGDVFLTPNDSNAQYRYKMQSSTVDEVEAYLYSVPSTDTDFYTRDSTFLYAVEPYADGESRMLVAPRPSSGGQQVFFRYTKDIGTPRYTASISVASPPTLSSTITLLGPDGETLSSSFTNEWFKTGARLIRTRAMFYLWSNYHGGTEDAAAKSQNYLMQWNEELLRLRTESNINSLPSRLKRYI